MAALDFFVRQSVDDTSPTSRVALLALGDAERSRRLGDLQSEIRARLAAASDPRDWRNQIGMIVADLRRNGHELRREGDDAQSHAWRGEAGQLAVTFCRDGNTMLDWQA